MYCNVNKITFIYCTNNDYLFNESVRYIHSLEVPEGIDINIISVSDAKSMCEGYNRAMKQSDAKYKVYLHQDTFIINKNLIADIINIFTKYPRLGIIGVVGAKKMPSSGVWWRAEQSFGEVYDSSDSGRIRHIKKREIVHDFESVEGLDGLILMTQYDLPWREDIFTGWHMYDVSQCAEFIKGGFQAGIPAQKSPWCLHDCGSEDLTQYNEHRIKYLEEYKNILSLGS